MASAGITVASSTLLVACGVSGSAVWDTISFIAGIAAVPVVFADDLASAAQAVEFWGMFVVVTTLCGLWASETPGKFETGVSRKLFSTEWREVDAGFTVNGAAFAEHSSLSSAAGGCRIAAAGDMSLWACPASLSLAEGSELDSMHTASATFDCCGAGGIGLLLAVLLPAAVLAAADGGDAERL